MEFKRVKEQDIDEIREIYSYYIKHSTATYQMGDISREEMRRLLIFDNPLYESYAIWDGKLICGYVILTQFKVREAFDQTAEVTIYLRHGYEGKGIGDKAIKFIEERAKTKPLHMLVALICHENIGSFRLFEKNGYEKCAHYKEVGFKFGRWLDLVCYQKAINQK